MNSDDPTRNPGSSVVLPKRLIEGMCQRGADYHWYGSRSTPIYTIEMRFNDDAHRFFVESCEDNILETNGLRPTDPLLQFVLPGDDLGVVPRLADQIPIVREANAILTAYQWLRAPDFLVGAPIPTIGPP